MLWILALFNIFSLYVKVLILRRDAFIKEQKRRCQHNDSRKVYKKNVRRKSASASDHHEMPVTPQFLREQLKNDSLNREFLSLLLHDCTYW